MEIQARAGWSRQHTSMVVNQKGFPDPVLTLGMGRIWLADEVEEWLAKNRPHLSGGTDGERA